MTHPLALLGRPALEATRTLGGCMVLLGRAASYIARGRWRLALTVTQCAEIGAGSFFIVVISLLFAGMVAGMHLAFELSRYGAQGLVGGIVTISVVREVGPTITAIVITARSGAAIAAELGTMKTSNQIDALRALGIDPVSYLVVPRLLAGLLMVPVLVAIANVVASGGAFLIASTAGVRLSQFLDSISNFVEPYDFIAGLAKAVVFGGMLTLVACWQGLRAKGGATGVGRATTEAVVLAVVAIIVSNLFMSWLLFVAFR